MSDARARELERAAAAGDPAAAAAARHAAVRTGALPGRQVTRTPAHDCIDGPCVRGMTMEQAQAVFDAYRQGRPFGARACESRVSHGRGYERWYFAVLSVDGMTVTAIQVSSGVNAPWTTIEPIAEGPSGSDLWTCTGLAYEMGHLLADTPPDGCIYLPSCRVYSTTGLGADAFWREHGVPGAGADQPESFWLALEALAAERDAEVREAAARVAAHRRCPTCGGAGTAPVLQRETAV